MLRARAIIPACFALLVAVAGLYLFTRARNTPFWADEWVWVLTRRANDANAFLKPNNGHLSLVPVVLYRILFATAGLDHRGPYAAMGVAAHLATATLVFAYAWRRIGSLPALLAGTLVLLLGPGWENILWPFQVAWLLSIGSGIAALLLLDRRDRLGDVAACVLLGVSLASSSVGIAIAVGLCVDVLWGRRRLRDAWIVALPIAAYGAWSLAFQDTQQFTASDILATPAFVGNAAAGAVSALVGLSNHVVPDDGTSPWGRPLAVAAALLVVWRLRAIRPVSPRVLTLSAMVASFWVLTALGRAVWGPTAAFSSRYVYAGAVLLVLLAIELARGVTVSARGALLLTAVVAVVTVSNVEALRNGASYLGGVAQQTRADLGALDIARPVVRPEYAAQKLPAFPLTIVQAAPYFEAERTMGSPAASPAEIAQQPEPARLTADLELIAIHAPALSAAAPAPLAASAQPPVVDLAQGGTVARRGACTSFRVGPVSSVAAPPQLQVTLPRTGALLRSDGGVVTVGLRRFAAAFQPLGTLTATSAATLRIAPDAAAQPWHLSVASPGGATVCALP